MAPQVTSQEVLLAARCKRVFANAHTYHINSISVNSDQETFLSADDLRINLWNLEITEQSFNMVDIKPNNMEDLTEVRARGAGGGLAGWASRPQGREPCHTTTQPPAPTTPGSPYSAPVIWVVDCPYQVITSAEFHPQQCNVFAYSSSKGCIRLADMRGAALCDRHSKAFEEQESQVRVAIIINKKRTWQTGKARRLRGATPARALLVVEVPVCC